MGQEIFHVRPRDDGKGWAIDCYDGRGAWQSTHGGGTKNEPMDKQQAQRRVFQLRRKVVNGANSEPPVNNSGDSEFDAIISRKTTPLPFVQRGMKLIHPDDSATWWEVEDCRMEDDTTVADVRSSDARRLTSVRCQDIRARWLLYEDYDPATVSE